MVQALNKIKETEKIDSIHREKNHNILDIYLTEVVNKYKYKLGTIFPYSEDNQKRTAYTHLTYEQMNEECDRYAHGFVERGIGPGSRVLLLVPPSLEFTVLFGTLFKIGAIPVLIDPGMGIRPMLKSIRTVKPDVFVGIPLAQLARVFAPKYFKSVKISITVGKRLFWGGPKLEHLRSENKEPFPIFMAKKDNISGIFFTTGSTGIPKGVIYTHGMFQALAETIQNFFQFEESSIDMPAFPPFALFCMAFGGTSVIPEMDPTQPAKADPKKLIRTIKDFGVNVSYGSPSIWNRVSQYCDENNILLPSMKRLMMFGAPVPEIVLQRFRKIMPNGETFTPYGATESLFVTNITGTEVCTETANLTKQGKGVCVGYVVPGMELKIIRITDDIITLDGKSIDNLTVPQGKIGEIIVRGPYVTKEYFAMPEKTAEAKIYEGRTFWHRMGDIGYIDEKGRLWYCGRKSHRINRAGKEYYSVMVEAHFNQLDCVIRSAMVGIPSLRYGQHMIIIIQLDYDKIPKIYNNKKKLEKFFLQFGRAHQQPIDAVLFKRKIPVDIRHNAKIKRDLLAKWAEKKIKWRLEK